MTLKEKKRKLSEILGINLFDSKFKEVDSIIEDGEKSVENKEQVGEKDAEPTQAAEDEKSNAEKTSEEAIEPSDTAYSESDDEKDNVNNSNEEGSGENSEDENQSADDTKSEKKQEDNATDDGQTEETKTPEEELFEAKLEAKLLRAGIREDKLDAAIKLFKADYTIADIALVDKWVKQYPEWKETKTKEQAKGFGMDVGEGETGETPEERRLRELGITK